MRIHRVFTRLTTLICLLICTSGTANATKSFIIDTDVGVDDVIAIMYLLNRPEIHVKAITIASTGNAHCLPALQNTAGLLTLMKHADIPIACGRSRPLSSNHHFPESVLVESDTLAGTAKLLPAKKITLNLGAVELMINTIRQSKQPVSILAIGPLTNIAEAITNAPDIKNRIEAIYVMGGAVNVPGNLREGGLVTANKSAEWNIYLDPLAASIVFQQPLPITLVPLDITNKVPIDLAFYNKLKKHHQSSAAKMVFSLLSANMTLLKEHQWYFWDPLAAVIASDESIAAYDMLPLKVVLTPERLSGKTAVDSMSGQTIKVVKTVDVKRFKHMLLDGLNTGTL